MDAINEERSHIFVGDASDDKLSNYRVALNKAIQQNSELRAKLNNIHITSDASNFPDPVRFHNIDLNKIFNCNNDIILFIIFRY